MFVLHTVYHSRLSAGNFLVNFVTPDTVTIKVSLKDKIQGFSGLFWIDLRNYVIMTFSPTQLSGLQGSNQMCATKESKLKSTRTLRQLLLKVFGHFFNYFFKKDRHLSFERCLRLIFSYCLPTVTNFKKMQYPTPPNCQVIDIIESLQRLSRSGTLTLRLQKNVDCYPVTKKKHNLAQNVWSCFDLLHLKSL